MAFKDQVVELVLRAKNMLSGDTDAAAKSVDELAGNAEGLQEKLRALEDQAGLITQFDRASKAVDRTASAYDRAQIRLDKLTAKLNTTGPLTERQAREFKAAQDAVDRAGKAYQDAEGTLGTLAKEAEAAGVDVTQLSEAQRENQRQTTQAKRALEDYNKGLSEGDGRLKRFGKTLASGAASFAAWASAALAAGAAAGSALLARMTANQAELARQTLASADAFGISTQALQEWQYAANSVGIEGDKVSDIMKDVSDKIGDAFLNGGGAAVDVIQQLNLDLEELVQLRPDEQLQAIGVQLQGLPKPAQVQILESLASDASLLLPLLENNSAALRELAAEAQKRGAILSEEELQRLADADKAFDRIKAQLDGFVKRVTGELAPTFEQLANDIDEFLTSNPQMIGDIVEAFRSLVTVTTEWLSGFLGSKDAIAGSFSTLANGANGLYQTFLALFRGVQAFAAGGAEVFARVIYDVNRLYAEALELANRVGLASDESVQAAQARVQNLAATVQDLEAKSEGYKQGMIEAGKAAATAFGNAYDGAKRAATGTNESRVATDQLADSVSAMGAAAETAERQTQSLALKQAELKQQLADLVPQIKAAQAELARDATSENQGRLAALVASYDRVVAKIRELDELSGTATAGIRTSAEVLEGVGAAADSVVDKIRAVYHQFVDLREGVKEVGDETQNVGKQAQESAGRVGASLAGVVSGWMEHITALSRGAAVAFREALGDRGATQVTSELEQRLAAVNNRIDEMQGRLRAGGAVGKVLRDWAQAGFEVEKSFLEQSIAVEKLTERILDGDRSVNVLGMSVDQIERQFNLLDSQQLSGLVGAVQSVRREVDSLRESLYDTISSLRQELAGLRGDTAQVEELRYLEKRQELEAQYQYARRLGDRDTQDAAKQALQLLEQSYQIRLRNAKAQDDAARKAEAERIAMEESNRQREEQEERQDISRQAARDLANQPRGVTTNRVVTLQFADPGGRDVGSVQVVDEAGVDQLLDALERSGYLTTR